METYKSKSMVVPPAWDTESSETTVYHNRGVTVIPATERTPAMYSYDVDEYTMEEYKETIEPEYAAAMRILLGEV